MATYEILSDLKNIFANEQPREDAELRGGSTE